MLIVAVEPDANQAKQLVSMAKRYLRAEFVVEGTAGAALKALGHRVPDLILTPVLLSSRDEALLTEHLRQLGPAAAHVQTLGIPILSSAEPSTRERGSRLSGRRKSPEPEAAGCEPSVFAEQVKIYLERAVAEQQARADMMPEAAVTANEPIAMAEESVATSPVEESVAPPSKVVLLEEDAYEEWLPVELPAEPVPEPPVSEPPPPPRKPRDRSHDRALEAQLGLIAPPGHTPHLWRVAAGLPDDTAASEAPSPVTPAPAFFAAPPMRRRSAANKPSPPLDDWAYFDPMQSGFKALIRRLDEVAAQYVSTDPADMSGVSPRRL
jgi:CheY-like chemotaxis protein